MFSDLSLVEHLQGAFAVLNNQRRFQSGSPRQSRFEGDKFPVLSWKNPENSHLELMTYLQD